MHKLQYLPHRHLNKKHIGKPMKLVLKNGKVIYGTIQSFHKQGIIFIPANINAWKRKNANAQWFFFPFLFIPFLFFIPFLICF